MKIRMLALAGVAALRHRWRASGSAAPNCNKRLRGMTLPLRRKRPEANRIRDDVEMAAFYRSGSPPLGA